MNKPATLAHQLTKHTKLLQKAVLVSGSQALIMRRSAKAHSRPEKWDLPGGNSEWPETAESRDGLHKDDLIREVAEETGINLDKTVFDPNRLIYFDTYFNADSQIYSVIANWWVALPANFPQDTIELSNEHTEYIWVTQAELDQYDFGGDKGKFVKQSLKTALSFSNHLGKHYHDHHHGGCGGNCNCGGDCNCK